MSLRAKYTFTAISKLVFDQTGHHSLAKLVCKLAITACHFLILFINFLWIITQDFHVGFILSLSLSVSLPPHINSENKIRLAPKNAKWNYSRAIFLYVVISQVVKLVWLLKRWKRALLWMKNTVTATKIPQWYGIFTVTFLCCLVSSGALAFSICGLHMKLVLGWVMTSL